MKLIGVAICSTASWLVRFVDVGDKQTFIEKNWIRVVIIGRLSQIYCITDVTHRVSRRYDERYKETTAELVVSRIAKFGAVQFSTGDNYVGVITECFYPE